MLANSPEITVKISWQSQEIVVVIIFVLYLDPPQRSSFCADLL